MEDAAPSNVEASVDTGTEVSQESVSQPQESSVDFGSMLGEEYSNHESIVEFLKAENPAQALAKSHIETKKMVGRPKIGVPGENASDAERASFYENLGVPSSPEDYGFNKPEDLPDSQYNAEHAQKWANLLHENKIPLDAANNLRQAMFEESQQSLQASNEKLNEAMQANFGDKTNQVVLEIQSLMKQAIPDEGLRQQISDNLQDAPSFALGLGMAMQHMKKTYGMADQNIGTQAQSSGRTMEEIRAEAQKLMASEDYRNPMSRDHSDVKKQVNAMYQQIGTLMRQKK